MSFIGISNAVPFQAYSMDPPNSKSGSLHFISVSSKDTTKISNQHTLGEQTKKDSNNHLHNVIRAKPFNLYNQDIIIPLHALLKNEHFDKDKLQIPLGATVNWKNNDTIDHYIQVFHHPSISFSNDLIGSKNLKPFETLSIKFDHPGKYIFQCSSQNHNFMKGSIRVR